jgi:hypothetical protein
MQVPGAQSLHAACSGYRLYISLQTPSTQPHNPTQPNPIPPAQIAFCLAPPSMEGWAVLRVRPAISLSTHSFQFSSYVSRSDSTLSLSIHNHVSMLSLSLSSLPPLLKSGSSEAPPPRAKGSTQKDKGHRHTPKFGFTPSPKNKSLVRRPQITRPSSSSNSWPSTVPAAHDTRMQEIPPQPTTHTPSTPPPTSSKPPAHHP